MKILMSPWLRLFLAVLLGLVLLEPARLLLGVEPLDKAEATVVSVEEIQSRGRGPAGLSLRFNDQEHTFAYKVDGVEHTARIKRPDATYKVGEVVAVTYFVRDPQSILMVDGHLLHFPYVRLVAAKLLVILLVGLSIQAYRINHRKPGAATTAGAPANRNRAKQSRQGKK